MKTLLLVLFFFGGTPAKDTTVYICAGPNAKKYHLHSDCRGLSNCHYHVVKTTLSAAKKSGKTLCGWEK
jgi:hypothetical protein